MRAFLLNREQLESGAHHILPVDEPEFICRHSEFTRALVTSEPKGSGLETSSVLDQCWTMSFLDHDADECSSSHFETTLSWKYPMSTNVIIVTTICQSYHSFTRKRAKPS